MALSILVFIDVPVHLAVTSSNGDIIGVWSQPEQMDIGFTRMIYPFAGIITFPSGEINQVKMLFGIVY
jgi:hypothetical protein